jgi:hypothetical protein
MITVLLIILREEFEETPGMEAGGTDIRHVAAFVVVAAVPAFPDHGLFLFEDFSPLHVLKKPQIALFMLDLDFRNETERRRHIGKAFV